MAHEQSHGHEQTNTGIHNRKLGFWLFLSSECVFFASLIVAYLTYHGNTADTGIPTPHEIFNIPLTSLSTFVLLMSSLTMVMAVNASANGLKKVARNWVLATALGGMVFLGFQVIEFITFVDEGLTLSNSLFGSTFFVLTGFHGAHVAIGVLWLLTLWWTSRKEGLGEDRALDVEIGGLYWHFVDVVWIVIFSVVYLLEFAK